MKQSFSTWHRHNASVSINYNGCIEYGHGLYDNPLCSIAENFIPRLTRYSSSHLPLHYLSDRIFPFNKMIIRSVTVRLQNGQTIIKNVTSNNIMSLSKITELNANASLSNNYGGIYYDETS